MYCSNIPLLCDLTAQCSHQVKEGIKTVKIIENSPRRV